MSSQDKYNLAPYSYAVTWTWSQVFLTIGKPRESGFGVESTVKTGLVLECHIPTLPGTPARVNSAQCPWETHTQASLSLYKSPLHHWTDVHKMPSSRRKNTHYLTLKAQANERVLSASIFTAFHCAPLLHREILSPSIARDQGERRGYNVHNIS